MGAAGHWVGSACFPPLHLPPFRSWMGRADSRQREHQLQTVTSLHHAHMGLIAALLSLPLQDPLAPGTTLTMIPTHKTRPAERDAEDQVLARETTAAVVMTRSWVRWMKILPDTDA